MEVEIYCINISVSQLLIPILTILILTLMKKIITLFFLIIILFAGRASAQDADMPDTGIINTIEVVNPHLEASAKATMPGRQVDSTYIACDSLTSTLAGGNGLQGTMFDVTALSVTGPVTITGFDVSLSDTCGFIVYYHAGTYVGTENTPSAWTIIYYTDTLNALPLGAPTLITLPSFLNIPSGQTYAFYLTSKTANVIQNYTAGTSAGAMYAHDNNLLFRQGCGIKYPFSGTPYSPRIWNGRIHYCYTDVVGVNELSLAKVTATAAPNPFVNSTVITIGGKTPKDYTIKIYDVLGKMVNEIKNINTAEVTINKGKLSDGMYYYRLYDKDEMVANGKLIIE